MIVIGITGALASGKSAVAAVFRRAGAKIFDADAAARRAIRKGTPAHRAILKLFGREFIGKGGEIDRRKLAWRVFQRPADLKKLNTLVHPGVIFDCLETIHKHSKKSGILALDVPLLFESKMEKLADAIVVVRASRAVTLARAERRGIPRPLAKKILSTQWSADRKARLADHVIVNNGSLKDLERRTREVIQKIQNGAAKRPETR